VTLEPPMACGAERDEVLGRVSAALRPCDVVVRLEVPGRAAFDAHAVAGGHGGR
jgi:hypothetical protein